jgi:hypothetical protein
MLPNLASKFPQHQLKVLLQTALAPSITFMQDGLTVVFSVDTHWTAFKAGEPNSDKIAFVTRCTVTTKAIATVANMRVVPRLLFLSQMNQLVSSEIGPFNPGVLDNYMNQLYDKGLIPLVNAIIGEGVPIPTIRYVALINPQIVWGPRYLAVLTDLQYTGLKASNGTETIVVDGEMAVCIHKVQEARKDKIHADRFMEEVRMRNWDKKTQQITEFFQQSVLVSQRSAEQVCEQLSLEFPAQTCGACACAKNCMQRPMMPEEDSDVFNMLATCLDDDMCLSNRFGLTEAERICVTTKC